MSNARQDDSTTIEFEILAGVGSETTRRRGTWADVIEAIPYFLYPGFPVPPLQVVNELLREGEFIAGMSGGCVWPPTVLDDAAYQAVVSDLLRRPDRRYVVAEAPEWVRTLEDYRFWGGEVAWGVPAAENRNYVQQLTRLGEEIAAARRQGEIARADALQEEQTRLHQEHGQWRNRHKRAISPDEPPFRRYATDSRS